MISFLVLVFELLGASKLANYIKRKFSDNAQEATSVEFKSVYNLITKSHLVSPEMVYFISHREALKFRPVFKNQRDQVITSIDGLPEWSINDDSLGTLTVSDDSLTAVFVPFSKTGVVTIDILIDSDLSDNEKAILGTVTVHIEGYENN